MGCRKWASETGQMQFGEGKGICPHWPPRPLFWRQRLDCCDFIAPVLHLETCSLFQDAIWRQCKQQRRKNLTNRRSNSSSSFHLVGTAMSRHVSIFPSLLSRFSLFVWCRTSDVTRLNPFLPILAKIGLELDSYKRKALPCRLIFTDVIVCIS